MASAWGQSWLRSWGDSWGSTATASGGGSPVEAQVSDIAVWRRRYEMWDQQDANDITQMLKMVIGL